MLKAYADPFPGDTEGDISVLHFAILHRHTEALEAMASCRSRRCEYTLSNLGGLSWFLHVSQYLYVCALLSGFPYHVGRFQQRLSVPVAVLLHNCWNMLELDEFCDSIGAQCSQGCTSNI